MRRLIFMTVGRRAEYYVLRRLEDALRGHARTGSTTFALSYNKTTNFKNKEGVFYIL